MELHLDWGINRYLFNVTRSSSRTTLRANNWLLSESSRGLESAAPIALNEHQNKHHLYSETQFRVPRKSKNPHELVNTIKIWNTGQTSDDVLNHPLRKVYFSIVLRRTKWTWILGKLRHLSKHGWLSNVSMPLSSLKFREGCNNTKHFQEHEICVQFRPVAERRCCGSVLLLTRQSGSGQWQWKWLTMHIANRLLYCGVEELFSFSSLTHIISKPQILLFSHKIGKNAL